MADDEEFQGIYNNLNNDANLEDPVTGNGQRNKAFEERITTHYNKHQPIGVEERPLRSLDSKWATIKHDTAKFCGCYETIKNLEISGTSEEDIIAHSLDLYKRRGVKAFVYVHCWSILSKVARWQDFHIDGQTTPSKATTPATNATIDCGGPNIEEDHSLKEPGGIGVGFGNARIQPPRRSKSDSIQRPQGSKRAKEEQRQVKIKEGLQRDQAKAAADMAAASLKKAEMLSEAANLAVFNMSMESLDSDMGREFLALRRGQVMKWLQKRLAEEAAIEATQVPTTSRRQRQRPSSPQVTLPTDDSDEHDDDIEGHGHDGFSQREPPSEDCEPVQENFSQSRRSPTMPIHGHSYEWPIFQMPVHHLDFAGVQGRFGTTYTPVNHEVLAQVGFRALSSSVPYPTCPPGPQ